MANYHHSKKTLLAFLTALSISLGASGCTNADKKQLRKEIETEIDTQVTSTPSPTLTPEELKKIEMEKLVTEYLDYFSTIDVEYPNEKYYPSKKEIDKILALDNTYQEYHHQDSFTMKKLYRIISKNTAAYVKKHPEFQNPFDSSTNNFNDYKSNTAFQVALEFLLKELKKESTNDFLEDICRIRNLKVVFGTLNENYSDSYVCATYNSKENRIIMDKKAIKKVPKKNKYDDLIDKHEITLKHELSHLKSHPCKHRLKKGQKFEEILGGNSTLMEASAESSTYALDKELGYFEVNSFDFAYPYEREDESLILLLGLFHDNMAYEDYYNAISDANPEAFYQFCGVKSKKEKYKLYKILAALDGRNGYNNIGFNIMKSNKISSKDAEKSIRYNYKLDIFHKVLSNMVDYTSTHPDFTIEENLQMLNIIECCISNDNEYLTTKNKLDRKFIIDFYQSETKYLDFLSSYYFKGEKDRNDIKEDYQENFIESTTFLDCYEHLDYDDNELLQEFPLLKPIIFANPDADYEYENFVEENKKFIKEKCKTK